MTIRDFTGRILLFALLFLLTAHFFLFADGIENSEGSDVISQSAQSVDIFLDITLKELDNFNKAYNLNSPLLYDLNSFNQSAIDDSLVTTGFSISGKKFKVISTKDKREYKRELRKVFSKELAGLAGTGNTYIYGSYKNAVVAKGKLGIGDLLTLNSIDGKKGIYIVSQKSEFDEESDDKTKQKSAIYFIKPMKAATIFDNARLEKKSLHIIPNISYGLSFSNPLGHIISLGIKYTKLYPAYLKIDFSYFLSPRNISAVGIRLGLESFLSIDGLYSVQTGLGVFTAFNIGLYYNTVGNKIIYVPDIELGLRWYFNSVFGVDLGVRFSDIILKAANGSVTNTININLVIGMCMLI